MTSQRKLERLRPPRYADRLSKSLPNSPTTSTRSTTAETTSKLSTTFGKLKSSGLDSVELVIHALAKPIISRLPLSDEHATSIILELTKPGSYSDELRAIAMKPIIARIKSGDICPLLKALTRWNLEDITLFLSHTIQLRYGSRPAEFLNLEELVLFMSYLARTTPQACRAVFNARFLELFLSIDHHKYDLQEMDEVYRAAFLHVARLPSQGYLAREKMGLLLIAKWNPIPPFIEVLKRWDVWEVQLLVENVMHQFSPLWQSTDITSKAYHQDSKAEASPSPSTKSIVRFLTSFLYEIACINTRTCQAVIQTGALDTLLFFLQKHCFTVLESFAFLLEMLQYNDELNNDAFDMLVYQLFHGRASPLIKGLAQRRDEDIDDLIFLVSRELISRYRLASCQPKSCEGARKSTVSLRLTAFLAQIAFLDDRCRQTVYATGILDDRSDQAVFDTGFLDELISAEVMPPVKRAAQNFPRSQVHLPKLWNMWRRSLAKPI